jgi:hypothetical protein
MLVRLLDCYLQGMDRRIWVSLDRDLVNAWDGADYCPQSAGWRLR